LKRTPEFVLGLIGGILGIIISILLIVVAFNSMEGFDYELLAYYSIILTVHELYPESWTLKKGPMIRGFCVFLSKNLVIMEPTIEMRYGEWVKLFLTKFK